MIIGRILIIGERPEDGDSLAHVISQQGIQATSVCAEGCAIDKYTVQDYDVVLINSYEMAGDGSTGSASLPIYCRSVRTQFSGPLLVLTCEHDERYHLQLYREGVDECVSKPVGNTLLLSKVKSWLRRARARYAGMPALNAGKFRLDALRCVLTTPEGMTIRVPDLEYRLFHVIVSNRGRVLAAGQLANRVWDDNGECDGHQWKDLVCRLRRKVEANPDEPRPIQTAASQGYPFRSNTSKASWCE